MSRVSSCGLSDALIYSVLLDAFLVLLILQLKKINKNSILKFKQIPKAVAQSLLRKDKKIH